MKDPEQEIEALLARLQPAVPDETLMARLCAARPRPQPRRKILYLWAPLAAAAGVAVALIPRVPETRTAPSSAAEHQNVPAKNPDELLPLGSLQHLVDVADLGIVQDENDMPVRLIRTRWIDEIVYESAKGGEPVKEGRLREEVMPVSLPVY